MRGTSVNLVQMDGIKVHIFEHVRVGCTDSIESEICLCSRLSLVKTIAEQGESRGSLGPELPYL